MYTDQIIEINPASKTERVVFDVGKVWRPEDHPLPDYMGRKEWTHANSIEYTASDPVSHQPAYLISFRQVSTILLIARQTGQDHLVLRRRLGARPAA